MATNGDDYQGAPEAETSFEVHLYIYDLSKELAKSFKKILKGKPLPGIWHTGLVAYGREYYFASSGIESCRPGETILGEPDQIMTLGKTELPYSVFLEYIFALGESTYKPGTYNLFEHNCNNFSQEVSNFLTGGPIPQELREIPGEILGNKNLSNILREYFDKLNLRAEGSKGISFGTAAGRNSARAAALNEGNLQNGDVVVNGQDHQPATTSHQNTHKSGGTKSSKNKAHSEQAKMSAIPNDVSKKEQPKDTPNAQASDAAASTPAATANNVSEEPVKPSTEERTADAKEVVEQPQANSTGSSEPVTVPSSGAEATSGTQEQVNASGTNASEEPRNETDSGTIPTFTSRRSRKYQDPAIIYPDVDGIGSYKKIMETVGNCLTFEEKQSMEEMLEYLSSPEGGAWALGSPHLDAIGRLLNDRNMPDEIPVLALHVLQAAALKEDVILLLHQDREHHHVMSYLYRIENLPVPEQENIATFMCNLCSNTSSFDWLMYISEWVDENGKPCNNSKVTVRVAVHSLLSEASRNLQEKGCALIYNLALKELFDDVATELAMAVLQFLQSDINEELAYRSLTALQRFMTISYNEVPALMKMLGPDVRKFTGLSERVDELADQIHTKVSVSTPGL